MPGMEPGLFALLSMDFYLRKLCGPTAVLIFVSAQPVFSNFVSHCESAFYRERSGI